MAAPLHHHLAKKVGLELSLVQGQVAWLELMASKFSLPDKDKAFRVVLTYAKTGDNGAVIFGKEYVASGKNNEPVTVTLTVEDFHVPLLEGFAQKAGLADISEAARVILDFAMTEGNEQDIFGVVRCKHGDSCNFCDK